MFDRSSSFQHPPAVLTEAAQAPFHGFTERMMPRLVNVVNTVMKEPLRIPGQPSSIEWIFMDNAHPQGTDDLGRYRRRFAAIGRLEESSDKETNDSSAQQPDKILRTGRYLDVGDVFAMDL